MSMTDKDEKLSRLAAYAAAASPFTTSTAPIAPPPFLLHRREEESLPSIGKRKRREEANRRTEALEREVSTSMCNPQSSSTTHPTPRFPYRNHNESYDGKRVDQLPFSSSSSSIPTSLKDRSFLPPREKKARELMTKESDSEPATSPSYRQLTPIQEELAILAEEGIYFMKRNDNNYKDSNKMKTRADWTYIEAHASPVLRSIIDRKKGDCKNYRNFYMYMNLQYSKGLKESFEHKRAEVRASLRTGKRMPSRCKTHTISSSTLDGDEQQGDLISQELFTSSSSTMASLSSTLSSDRRDYHGDHCEETGDRMPSVDDDADENDDSAVTTNVASNPSVAPEVITISEDSRSLNVPSPVFQDRPARPEEKNNDCDRANEIEPDAQQDETHGKQYTNDDNAEEEKCSQAHQSTIQEQAADSTIERINEKKTVVLAELEFMLKQVQRERVEQQRRNEMMLSWMSTVENHVVQLIETAKDIKNEEKL
mmetsp:Transcript_36696/g.53659  ORF Transcript_36696/g.53659 Transcript_36696/m.53659 type:complete len:482 (+) Transcript_36696:278-1723(+)